MTTLLIVDADFILYAATAGNKVLDPAGNPLRENNRYMYTDKTLQEVKQTADKMMIALIDVAEADFTIGYLSGKSCFRNAIYPAYKMNRAGRERPKLIDECRFHLANRWNFPVTSDIEADDAVNITRNQLQDSHNCIIASPDKDLIKCIPGRYINTRHFQLTETTLDDAQYCFWKSMLVGDSIDNIPGLKKCGNANANRILSKGNNYEELVKMAYYDFYGYSHWQHHFELNYRLLKILDSHPGFRLATLKKVRRWGEPITV